MAIHLKPEIAAVAAPASVPLGATSVITITGVKPGNTTVRIKADSGKLLTMTVKVVDG